ncbi:MAG: hypothetical protein RSE33_20520, partial [Hafnia sp.]
MKKILYTLLAGLFALTSCSKEATEELATQTEATTFTFSVAGDELQTRATGTITPARYVMEVWSADGTTAENVFDTDGTPTNRAVFTGASITVTLDKTKAYTCLFWADDNATYNAASLKAISLNSGKTDYTEAYYAKKSVATGGSSSVSVTLSRAVAKINLTETTTVKTTENLVLKFTNIYPTFSVSDGATTGTAAEWTKTVTPAATTGTIGTFYFFAQSASALTEFTFTYASEGAKTVSNVPYQQNHATNIKGEYSSLLDGTFTVSADDGWN